MSELREDGITAFLERVREGCDVVVDCWERQRCSDCLLCNADLAHDVGHPDQCDVAHDFWRPDDPTHPPSDHP